MRRALISVNLLALLALAGCTTSYSPNTYSSNAVQLASKVEAGTIIGYREVLISANGNIGTVTGAAAGGVLGAEYADSALAAVGASTVGGLIGNALDHAAGDTTGWEYIIRKPNSDMVSVTQREKTPLSLGQRVLVIMGPQARVVPDYSVAPEPVTAAVEPEKKEVKAPEPPVKVEVVLSLPPGVTVHPAPMPEIPETQAAPAPQSGAIQDLLKAVDALAVAPPLVLNDAVAAADSPCGGDPCGTEDVN